MDTLLNYSEFLAAGALVTLQLTVAGCLLALAMSFLAGLGRLAPWAPVRWVAIGYIEFFRGTSCLVQMFWIFYALPYFGILLPPLPAGIMTLGLNIGAYGAEVVRAAILSVSRDQVEAGVALNYTGWQRMRHILLPQALPVMLPSFGNLAIDLMKLSSVASLITISDLTFRAQLIRNSTGETLWPFLSILVVYFLIATVMIKGIALVERRLTRGFDGVRSTGSAR